jgi:DNA repair exonuclease SbcCD nuclease subunit/energy-coupling factor transporter ATP-binding protein EcfA2
MGMKILCCADLHIGRRATHLPQDFGPGSGAATAATGWSDLVAHAIREQVNLVLMAGDVVDWANRFYEAYGPLETGVRKLLAAGIQVWAVAGNHDVEALPKLAEALGGSGFRLLGRGGTWERATFEEEGRAVLHVDGWSFPEQVVKAPPLATYRLPSPGGLPSLVLLHADLDQADSKYAPLSRRDMSRIEAGFWLLGHIHSPRHELLPGGIPFLYPGSPLALDPGETGEHGPWLLELNGGRFGEPRQQILSRTRYEKLRLHPGELADLDRFDTWVLPEITRHARRIVEGHRAAKCLSLRVELTGRTPLHGRFGGKIAQLTAEARPDIDGIPIRIDSVEDNTSPARDLAELARGENPAGFLAALLLALEQETPTEELDRLLAQAAGKVAGIAAANPYMGLEEAPPAPGRPEILERMRRSAGALLESLLAKKEGAAGPGKAGDSRTDAEERGGAAREPAGQEGGRLMERKPLLFESIQIDRMPGFPPHLPFRVEGLQPGTNIITGPNMSGKTTLARTMAALLWPKNAPKEADVKGSFRFDGAAWIRHVEDRATRACLRDGQAAAAPEPPPREEQASYHVELVELLQKEAEGRDFATLVARETAGGYDLDGAAREVGASASAGKHGQEVDALKKAVARVAAQRDVQQKLAGSEGSLVELEARRKEAVAAATEARRVEAAIKMRAASTKLDQATRDFEAFPAAMSKVSGDEAKRLADLRQKLAVERKGLAQAEEKISSATAAASRTKLTEQAVAWKYADRGSEDDSRQTPGSCCRDGKVVSTSPIKGWRSLCQELAREEDQCQVQRREVGKAAAAAAEACRVLGAEPAAPPLALDAAALAELARFAQQAEQTAAGREAWRQQKSALQAAGQQEVETAQRLRDGRKCLTGWLRSSPEGDARQPGPDRSTYGLAGLCLTASLLLALLAHWLFWGVFILAAGMAVLVLRRGRTGEASADRAHYERDYVALGLEAPEGWTVEGVGCLLEALVEREARAAAESGRAGELRRVEAELARVEAEEAKLRDRAEELRRRFGAAPEGPDEGKAALFFAFVEQTSKWWGARQAEGAARAALEAAEVHAAALLTSLNQGLAAFGYPSAAGSAVVLANVEDLADRLDRFEKAAAALEASRLASVSHAGRIRELEAEIAGIFSTLALADGDEAGLAERMRHLASYRQANDAQRQASTRKEDARRRLDEIGGGQGLEGLGEEELAAKLAGAEKKAAEFEDIASQIAVIESQVRAARGNTTLTEALADLQECKEALRKCRHRDGDAAVAAVLVEHLKEQVRTRARPPVFRRADELFARFTTGRCRLDVNDAEPPGIRVVETGELVPKELDALSSATRLQVLLAVRLAYIETQEKKEGVVLPLLLDEALANCDEERALAVVGAVAALAAAGRQIFYFTAQQDEVGKWKAICEREGAPAPNVVDLARVRQLEQMALAPLLQTAGLPVPTPPPTPGESMLEYGRRLAVPGIDPRPETPDHVHLWHLVETPEELYALMRLSVHSWGQLRILLSSGGVSLLGAEQAARIEAAARSVEAACEQWRLGRGRPVDRGVLRESAAVSDKFIEEVAALAESCGHEATALVRGLETGAVKGFRKDKAAELRSFLVDSGYLDERLPVAESEARIFVLARLADRLTAGHITPERIAALVASAYSCSP